MKYRLLEKKSATARRLGGIKAIRQLPLPDRLWACAVVMREVGRSRLATKFGAELFVFIEKYGVAPLERKKRTKLIMPYQKMIC